MSTRQRTSANDIVLKTLGILLLAAVVLKGHEPLTVPAVNKNLWSWRPFLVFPVELQLVMGIWLLSGIFKQLGWLAALSCFSPFCSVTVCKALTGAASCGCFGRVHVAPWISLFLVGLPTAVALVLFRPPGLRPQTWGGKELPIHRYIRITDQSNNGTTGALFMAAISRLAKSQGTSRWRLFQTQAGPRLKERSLIRAGAMLIVSVADLAVAGNRLTDQALGNLITSAYLEGVQSMSVPGVDRTFCEKLLGRCEVQLDCSEVRESSDIARRLGSLKNERIEIRLRYRAPHGACRWFTINPQTAASEELDPIEVRDCNNGIAYVRWRSCSAGSSRQAVSCLSRVQRLCGVVVDLRGNAGGHLAEAVLFASQWLPKDKEVVGLAPDVESYLAERYCMILHTTPGERWRFPVVFITNGQTASSAEVMLAIFKAQLGSVSVGATTQGDALASMLLMESPSEMPRYQSVLIRVIDFPIYHGKGISPDVQVPVKQEQSAAHPNTTRDRENAPLQRDSLQAAPRERCISLARDVSKDGYVRVLHMRRVEP